MSEAEPSGTGTSSSANGFTSARSLLASSSSSSPGPTPSTSASTFNSQPQQQRPAAARFNSMNGTSGSKGKEKEVAPEPVRTGSGGDGVTTASVGAGGGGAAAAPTVGIVRRPTLNAIMVNVCQKGNPVITHVRSVPWEYGDIVPDYQVGSTTGVLYLSLRYHLLHPEYIHSRIEKMGQSYTLRIMMVHCDVDNHATAIKELTKICIINNYTMIVAWSAQEVGRYLETYKTFERKPPDLIKERVDEDYMSRLTNVLTTIKGVNKTDVVTLASNYGSFEKIVLAEPESLEALPGLGEKKVRRMRETFQGNFMVRPRKKKSAAEERAARGNRLN